GRTHHAVRLDTPDLADLDGERLLARLGREAVTWENERHLVPRLEVVRAAHDLPFPFAVIDAAERELVRVRMFVPRDDLRHNDPFKLSADLLDTFDLNADHRQPLGQFFRWPIEINVLFEPVESDLHWSDEMGGSFIFGL